MEPAPRRGGRGTHRHLDLPARIDPTPRSARRSVPPKLCAAYFATCIPGTSPPRAALSLASATADNSTVGLGFGVPTASGWRLRPWDFCKEPPVEISTGPVRRGVELGRPTPQHCFCPTHSFSTRLADPLGYPRRVPAGSFPLDGSTSENPNRACPAGAPPRRFVAFQCSSPGLLVPPALAAPPTAAALVPLATPSTAGGADVFIATFDHYGHGLFALVERVLNQLHFAKKRGLEPSVHLGEHTFMEPQACEFGRQPYFDAPRGANVWEYWFVQPGQYALGAATVKDGRPVRSLQVASVETVTVAGPVQIYASGGPRAMTAALQRHRAAAHEFVGDGGAALVRPHIRAAADAAFAPWRARSSHIVGAHVRGTDKVVRPKVPAEAYFPLLDAYVAAHDDALIFVATDDRRYMRMLLERYGDGTAAGGSGRVVYYRRAAAQGATARVLPGYDGQGAIGDRSLPPYEKGEDVLVDALLLSKADFLLKTASGVAEFAMWAAPALGARYLDLQYTDRFRSQPLPPWTRRVPPVDGGAGGGRALAVGSEAHRSLVADAYCAALAAGCARECAEFHRRAWPPRPGAPPCVHRRPCSKCDAPRS